MTSEHPEEVVRESTDAITTPAPAPSVERSVATAYDPYAGRRQVAARLVQAIYLIFGIIEALILIRIVLRALGANPDAGFAQLIR